MKEIIIKTEEKQHPSRLLRPDECFKIEHNTVTLYYFPSRLSGPYFREGSVYITDFDQRKNALVIRGRCSQFNTETRDFKAEQFGILISPRRNSLIPVQIPHAFEGAETALEWTSF